MKQRRPDAQIGLAHHLRIFDAARRFAPQDNLVAWAFQRVFNETMLRSLREGRLVFPLTRRWEGLGAQAQPGLHRAQLLHPRAGPVAIIDMGASSSVSA